MFSKVTSPSIGPVQEVKSRNKKSTLKRITKLLHSDV